MKLIVPDFEILRRECLPDATDCFAVVRFRTGGVEITKKLPLRESKTAMLDLLRSAGFPLPQSSKGDAAVYDRIVATDSPIEIRNDSPVEGMAKRVEAKLRWAKEPLRVRDLTNAFRPVSLFHEAVKLLEARGRAYTIRVSGGLQVGLVKELL